MRRRADGTGRAACRPARRPVRMRVKRTRRSRATVHGLCAVLALSLVAPVATAQPTLQIGQGVGTDRVTIDADSIAYDQDGAQLRAEGDVVISSGSTVLAADEISVRRATAEADAAGDVLIDDPEARIRADRAWFQLDDETGFLVDGEVHLRRSRFLLSGERLEKGLGQSYRLWDGELTTCLCEDGTPDWSIEGEQIDLGLGGWGEVRGGLFKVKGVPILYLPYGLLPVQRDRQSGFLFPRFGQSNQRGFQYLQPFYWAINKSSDLTMSLDVETEARIGLLADYRYVLSPTAGGRLTASYFNEHIRGDRQSDVVDPDELADPTIPENRWSVIGHHQQEGPFGSRIYARPFYVSDNLFLREMNTLSYVPATNLFLTTIRYTTSELGLVKVGSWGEFLAEARWYQDLIKKQSRQPQPLPRIRLNLRDRWFDRLTARLNTEAVYYYRAPLSSGPRLDIRPQLTLPYRLGVYGFGSIDLQLRETLYYLFNNEVPDGLQQDNGTLPTRTVPRFQHRETLRASINFQSEISRVYELNLGRLSKVKHTIEPFVGYLYTPFTNQDDLPVWDGVDRINARNLLTYGILTRLLGKFGAPVRDYEPPPSPLDDYELAAQEAQSAYPDALIGDEPYGPVIPPLLSGARPAQIRELARVRVQQSYAIGFPPTVSVDDEERVQDFSGIDLRARITPVGWAGLSSKAVYSLIDNKFVFANVGANLFDPRPIEGEGDVFQPNLRPVNSASVYYQFNTNGAVENLNIATTLRLTNYLGVSYLGRFDGETGSFLEHWGGVRIISGCDCWVIDAAMVQRVNPDEQQFRVRVSLVGLGTFGQSPYAEFNNAFPTPTTTGPAFGEVF